jgi:hypothetical protein
VAVCGSRIESSIVVRSLKTGITTESSGFLGTRLARCASDDGVAAGLAVGGSELIE